MGTSLYSESTACIAFPLSIRPWRYSFITSARLPVFCDLGTGDVTWVFVRVAILASMGTTGGVFRAFFRPDKMTKVMKIMIKAQNAIVELLGFISFLNCNNGRTNAATMGIFKITNGKNWFTGLLP